MGPGECFDFEDFDFDNFDFFDFLGSQLGPSLGPAWAHAAWVRLGPGLGPGLGPPTQAVNLENSARLEFHRGANRAWQATLNATCHVRRYALHMRHGHFITQVKACAGFHHGMAARDLGVRTYEAAVAWLPACP